MFRLFKLKSYFNNSTNTFGINYTSALSASDNKYTNIEMLYSDIERISPQSPPSHHLIEQSLREEVRTKFCLFFRFL